MYASNSVFTSCYVIPFSKGEMVMMLIHDYDHTQKWYVHDNELEMPTFVRLYNIST